MKYNQIMIILRKILPVLIIFILLPLASVSAAVIDPSGTNYGLNDPTFQQLNINQGSDLKDIVVSIINIALGLLGIIAVIIIMYGGFKWMTAAGNEDQVTQARKMIIDGVIGLVVIFLAWAIASFVINQLVNATGAQNGTTNATAPQITSSSQNGTLTNNNNQVGGSLLGANSGSQTNNLSLSETSGQNIDSDGDGLTDAQELNVYHTDPNKSDTDGDGFTDGAEAQNGYSPAGAGKIVDAQNSQSCSSLLPLLAGALGNPAKLADAQKQIKDCCAQKQDPLCSGF